MKRSLRIFMMAMAAFVILVSFAPHPGKSWPRENQLPPMGWEPWNIDHCGNQYQWDEAFYQKLADFFVTSGLRDLGYSYLTIECGDHYRDKSGQIQVNLHTFPHGFQAITGYIHRKGLKARAYTDAGEGSCCCFEGAGSLGHYQDDANRWVEFGFDGVKIDWCGGDSKHLDPRTQFLQFADAIRKTNHPLCVEICCWGKGNPWEWGRTAGTMWRTGDDIDADAVTKIGGSWRTLMRNLDANRHPSAQLVGPGVGWNYPDMLLVGRPGGPTDIEKRTQFSMWAVVAAPLFLGNDVFHMSPYARDTVMNKEAIAVDQDPLGVQGDVVKEYNGGKLQVWVKKLKNGANAIALLNRDATTQKIAANWNDLGLAGEWSVRDLWEHAEKGNFAKEYSATVASHATVLLKISPVETH